MITVAIKHVWQSNYSTLRCHSREQILIFCSDSALVVTTDGIESLMTKHGRAMGKRDVGGATDQPPPIPRSNDSAAGIDPVAESSYRCDVRSTLDDTQLASETIGVRHVVGIHSRDDRSSGFRDNCV